MPETRMFPSPIKERKREKKTENNAEFRDVNGAGEVGMSNVVGIIGDEV